MSESSAGFCCLLPAQPRHQSCSPAPVWVSLSFCLHALPFKLGIVARPNWLSAACFCHRYWSAISRSSCMQSLALKLGVVAERDLAQCCRDGYPRWVNHILWILMEVAIAATDLAEIIGSAIALNLLFGLPLWAGTLITLVDVLVLVFTGMHSFRLLEVVVVLLCALIGACFIYEMAVVKPDWAEVGKGFIPR